MNRIQKNVIIAAVLLCLLLVPGVVVAQKGTIYVDSVPQGAEIYATTQPGEANLTVDELVGVTPQQFFLDPGTYTIYVKKFGYGTWWVEQVVDESTNVYLNGGVPVELTPTEPIYGALHVSTEPPEANVVLTLISKAGVPVTYESVVHGLSPLSLESLTPGTYSVYLNKTGYVDYINDDVEVVTGEVTELDVPLVANKQYITAQFKSQPAGANVWLFGGSEMIGSLSSEQETTLSVAIQNTTDPDEAMAAASAILPEAGLILSEIGLTPFEMQLPEGTYIYLMELQGYEYAIGEFEVNLTTSPDPIIINETLEKSTEFIDVYFETVNPAGDPLPGIDMFVDEDWVGTTPGWAPLPNPALVDVVFNSLPVWDNTTVNVDTSMFTGRPSKWGEPVVMNRKIYTITVSPGPHIVITPGTQTYESESNQTFTITTDDEAYEISEISLDGTVITLPPPYTSVTNHTIQNILADHTLSANARLKTWYVTAEAGKGGNITPSEPNPYPVTHGTDSPVYYVTPWDGYTISAILMDGVSKPISDIGYQFTNVVANHTIEAQFRPTHVTVTPLAGPGGNITPSTPVVIPYNTGSGQFCASANPGYTLLEFNWSYTDDFEALGLNDPCTSHANVTQNMTVTALFKKLQYMLTAEASAGGTIEPTEAVVDYGDSQLFTMNPETGNSLVDLTDNNVSVIDQVVNNTYTIDPVTEDHALYATFSGEELIITATAGPGGSIDPQGEVKVPYGNDQSFTVTADAAFVISDIIIGGTDHYGPQASPYTYTFTDVIEDSSIEAVFSQVVYTITPSAGTGGTIDPSTVQQVDAGDNITFTITADSCHSIGDIVIDGISMGPQISPNSTEFKNVAADHTIDALFNTKTFTITSTVRAPGGGTIEPLGVTEVYCGADQTYNMSPDPGNAVLDVIVDGTSVGPVMSYTFTNVQENGHTIEAVFILPPDPDFSANITRVPPNYPVQFHDLTKNNPVAWYWQFGDSQFSNLQEPIHYYTEVGLYNVTLTAFNEAAPVSSGGVSITKNEYIEVTNDPIARFTAKPVGGTTPPGFEVNFTDMSLGGPLIYSWNFGDNSPFSYATSPHHIYTTPGVYQVTLQVQKPNVGYDYAYETITVLQEPVADFSAHPLSGRQPLEVHFVDESQGFPSSWLWDFGDGQGSFEAEPSHTYHSAGLYNITLAIKNYEGEDMITKEGYIEVI